MIEVLLAGCVTLVYICGIDMIIVVVKANDVSCNCRTFPTQMSELSFMHIFGERARVPGAVIIDGGYRYCITKLNLNFACLLLYSSQVISLICFDIGHGK